MPGGKPESGSFVPSVTRRPAEGHHADCTGRDDADEKTRSSGKRDVVLIKIREG